MFLENSRRLFGLWNFVFGGLTVVGVLKKYLAHILGKFKKPLV